MAGEATGGREELILLGFWSSPFVMRARFVLNLKGLPYEYVEEDLFNNKSQLLLASNPVHKKVPVLIHNGKPVCESMVIVQYIDEAFPSSCPRVLPSNPHERAAARFWAANVDDKLFSTWIPVYNGRTVEDRVEAARQLIAVLQMFERAFRECSNGKAFFGGDSVGLVDVVLGSFLGWLNASEAMCGVKVIDAAKTPLLAAWAERFGALDGVKEVMPDTQRLVEYNMMRRARHGLPLLLPYQELEDPRAELTTEIKQGLAMGGGGDGLKLLGVWDSPYVNRVQIVLNLKGITYEYVEEDLLNKSDLLLASNPVHKKVPVLIHNGKSIPESQVIVQYVDEVFGATGPSVLPADPYERATARFWAAYVDDKVGSPWYTILFARKTEEKVEAATRVTSALETLEGAFKECSGGEAFFGGDGIGFVDVVLGSYLGWFKVIQKMIGVKVMDAARTPLLAAWAERFEVADAVKGVLPDDVDKVLEFLQTFLD